MDTIRVAMLCHEFNRMYCEMLGDTSQKRWGDAEQWQRDSAIKGVNFHIENPDADAAASHKSWYNEKLSTGWTWGPVKDSTKREHPCMVPFEQLPQEQQFKDYMFKSIVHGAKFHCSDLFRSTKTDGVFRQGELFELKTFLEMVADGDFLDVSDDSHGLMILSEMEGVPDDRDTFADCSLINEQVLVRLADVSYIPAWVTHIIWKD